ncbi:MAG: sensor histidine kinase, partial [Flavobacteriaceae bacterium]
MAQEFKKSYKFAIRTALYLSLFLTLFLGVFLYFFFQLQFVLLISFAVICFLLSFVITQYRVENFIYKRVKKIYDDLTLLESKSFTKEQITTDMSTLTEEIDKYARDKKLEIETLKVREQYRKEFMGNVSHELKTPLFTVQGYIETLLDGAIKDDKINKKYLQRANKGVERLTYIIRDLDMITKLETGDLILNIEEFDIVELVRTVFELLEMKAAKKKIKLIFDTDYPKPILVRADKERIEQVLSNLIVNSIKYGVEKGITEVSIENLIKNKVIVRVTDNGEGIEIDHLPRLFERFYRVDKSGSRKVG